MELEKGLEKYEHLKRDEYFEKNQELAKNLWNDEDVPTVADIAEFVCGFENPRMNKIFEFFDNKEEFIKMTNRTDSRYKQEESSNFIRKVMSANNEEISKAGYFYKLLMASADDFRIFDGPSCSSPGEIFKIDEITKDIYNYKIRSMFVKELNTYCKFNFDTFEKKVKEKNLDEIHVKTPLTCSHASERQICKKCAGLLPHDTRNIGTFTTLMVTEHATQNALSSMNKGIKTNINDLIALRYEGAYNWDSIVLWIRDIIDKLTNDKVQSRFYEIALLSRVRKDEYGPFVSSLKGSINHSNNLFGSYIFNPNYKNFEKIVRAKSFNDDSLKLKIAINNYE